jgi:hypothetical protein
MLCGGIKGRKQNQQRREKNDPENQSWISGRRRHESTLTSSRLGETIV